MNETDLKRTLKDLLRYRGVFFYHNLQGVGCFKGLPDLCLHYKHKVHYLEVKLPKGKMSDNQIAFQEQCRRDKIPYHIIRSLEDLQEIVK